MPRIATNSRRSRTSCSLLALATALVVGASPASAQSFLGTGVYVTNPNATGITTGLDTTTINLNGGQTIIDWTPTDNASGTGTNILFQPADTTATFTASSDFAVLNRVMVADATRAIVMNGTVNARVNGAQRGSVYFYSPGGFIFGGTSVFSVGSLVVTALPITLNGSDFITNMGSDNSVVFGQATNPDAFISSNGSISAVSSGFGISPPGNAYVAMVAPRVVHNGTINVNGSAALVGAEAATISFSTDGLFDIQVTTGTTSTSGVEVYGDIGGPTPGGATDKQGIYLVAVPKNDALTMVIGGGADLGFELANSAVDDNGVIILSAGHDIANGQVGAMSAGHGAEAAANFWFTGAHATNNLIGEATGYADLYSTDGQASQLTTVFDSDVTVHANDHVWMNAAGAGATLTVAGNLWLSTDQTATDSGGSAQGGYTALYALNGGSLTVNGNALLTANGYGGSTESPGEAGGTGTGGQVNLHVVDGGNLHILGNVDLQADGFGGASFDGNGGAGIGGTFDNLGGITISAQNGTLTLDNLLTASASGFGGEAFTAGTTSGNGTGGDVSVWATADGDVSVAGHTSISAEGRGGIAWDVDADGGDGQGGSINLSATGAGSTLSLAGGLISANGEGGGPGEGTCCVAIGGDGLGGRVNVTGSTGGLIESNGTLELSAAGSGGFGSIAGGNGTGGDGFNGVFVHAPAGLTINIDGNLWLDGTASGGDGEGAGGTGTGGHALLHVDGGTVNVTGELNVDADGFGGDSDFGGNGGNGAGGLAEVLLTGGSSLLTVGGRLLVESDGTGGDSFNEGPIGNGGSGTGGRAGVYANGGTLQALWNVEVSSIGTGGFGDIGGTGTGMLAELVANGGTVTIDGWASVSADGIGGDGLTAGGDGIGGGLFNVNFDGAHIYARNGSITMGGAWVSSAGFGGSGGEGSGGQGGDGTGGYATIHAANSDLGPSTITVSGVESIAHVSTDGHGGAGGDGASGNSGGNGGDGGNGTGGFSAITAAAGNGTVNIDFAVLTAQGFGGAGGNGGNGDGGPGGNGGAGGDAFGGQINVGTESGTATASNLGVGNYGAIFADASAWGGQGGDGNFGATSGNGGAGGNADGGTSVLLVRGSTVNVDFADLVANATGGDGGLGGGETGVAGAGGNAESDEAGVLATGRFLIPTHRGTLNAGTITATVTSTGGSGSVNGASLMEGGSGFVFENSDGTIGSVDFNISAGGLIPDLAEDSISIVNGDVSVANSFSFLTDGHLSFYIDNGSLTAGSLVLSASDFVANGSLPAPTLVGTAFADSLSVTSGGDFIADANLNVVNGIDITVPGSIRFNNANSISFVNLWAQGGSIDLDDVTSDGDVHVNADGTIDVGTVQAGFFRGDAGATFTSFDITSDSNIQIQTVGNVSVGDLNAGLTADEFSSKAIRIDTFTGSVLVGDIVALGGIDITAGGSVTGGNVTTGDVLFTDALGAITYGNISAGLVNPQPPTEPASVGLNSATSITVGNIEAAQIIGLVTSGTLTAGNLDSGTDILGLVHGNMTIGDINADGRVLLADSSMFTDAGGSIGTGEDADIDIESIFAATPVATAGSITVGTVLAGSFTAAAGTSLTTGLIDTDSEITLGANGAITTGNLFAGDFVLANGGSITTGNIDASSVDMTSTGGNIATGDIFAFGGVALDAFGDIATGDIFAGTIDLLAGDDIATGDLTTQVLALQAQEGSGPAKLFPGASITLNSGGDIATGNIDSIDGVYADAGGTLSTGTIDAVDFVELFAVDDISTGYIDAGQYILVESGGDQSLGNLNAGWDIDLEAGGSVVLGNANAGTEFDFDVGGNITGGNVVAGIEIGGEGAGGNVVFGDLTAGFGEGETDVASIGFSAGGSITVGNVNSATSAGFAALGNLATGNIQTGDDFLALVSGNITTGSITTGEGDQVYMAHSSMCVTGGGCSEAETDFDPEIVFALDPVPTGGSITIGGPVNTGQFDAAAGTSLTTQAIAATGDIHASAGGMATLNGVWTAGGDVSLASNDIDITASGGINASGSVGLFSTNATQALIGDGLSGSGYALSNAEFGRISGHHVGIGARGDASAAIDMLIGDLTVTGPLVGSTVEGADGVLAFAVGDIDSETISGVIRVNGDVAATGFGSGNAIEFYADRFELDAATGSVSIFSSGSTLGGELGLFADRIHVAEGAILDQLASNPTYTGYQQDLDEPATVQRPEGVLRADTLWIESGNLQSILIQNTGTFDTRAGFLVRQAFVNDDQEVAGPPGSINLVVNGQVVTEGGTLTGVAARDALIDEETDITPFTSNSTINGCPLTGECIIQPPPPPPTADIVDSFIDLIGGDPLGDSEFGNEEDIDDNEEGDEGANNPISPPQPLFDSRALIPSGDVNDPVSGTGNPALLGSDQCEEDENGQCPAKPVNGDGQ